MPMQNWPFGMIGQGGDAERRGVVVLGRAARRAEPGGSKPMTAD
jgi:hypothetical protein